MSKIIVKDLAGPASSSNKIYIASGSELDIANSSGTINLAVDAGDIASGTLANARLADGHILQVVQTVKSDVFSGTSNESEVDITGMTATITPTDSSNKVLIQISLTYSSQSTTYKMRLKRGTTDIGLGDADGVRQRALTGLGFTRDGNQAESGCFLYLDSPATTSATTYKITVVNDNTQPLYINRSVDDQNADTGGRYSSSITLMEVKA